MGREKSEKLHSKADVKKCNKTHNVEAESVRRICPAYFCCSNDMFAECYFEFLSLYLSCAGLQSTVKLP